MFSRRVTCRNAIAGFIWSFALADTNQRCLSLMFCKYHASELNIAVYLRSIPDLFWRCILIFTYCTCLCLVVDMNFKMQGLSPFLRSCGKYIFLIYLSAF